MKSNKKTFQYIGAGVALIVACIFAFIGDGVPQVEGSTMQAFIVNYFHTFTWFCLSIALFTATRTDSDIKRLAKPIGLLGLVFYIVFQLAINKIV